MASLDIKVIAGGIEIAVLASPGSSMSKVRSLHAGALKVAVRAAPEKGKANAEVEEVLSDFFGVSIKNVNVVSGQTSRNKRVQILGVDESECQAALARLG